MNLILDTLQSFLPLNKKSTPSGWISFDAPCCVHNGESHDTRKRGGVLIRNEGFQYHCFNCNFSAGWQPGKLLSKNTKLMYEYLGVPVTDIQKLNLYALKTKEDLPVVVKKLSFDLDEKEFPENTLPLITWAEQDLPDAVANDLVEIFTYLDQRGMNLDWYPWHWSYSPGYKDRVLIPFYQEGRLVGWTGRKVKEGKPKYLTDSQPGYVFNIDKQTYDRKFVIVVEGQFDAIAIDGVAIMTNDPNDTQIARINRLNKEVIVVPDRDAPGSKLIQTAIDHGWAVSLPEWEQDIKDVADAVCRYGRIYTLVTILKYKETNEIKKQLLKKKLENV